MFWYKNFSSKTLFSFRIIVVIYIPSNLVADDSYSYEIFIIHMTLTSKIKIAATDSGAWRIFGAAQKLFLACPVFGSKTIFLAQLTKFPVWLDTYIQRGRV